MDTYLWRYTHPRDGRVITKDHFTEAEALRIFPEPEPVEGSRLSVEPSGPIGWAFASGLVVGLAALAAQDNDAQAEAMATEVARQPAP